MSTKCEEHSGHEAMIAANAKDIADHNADSTLVREKLFTLIEEIKDDWNKRLPLWVTGTLMFLSGLCSAMAVFIITHK